MTDFKSYGIKTGEGRPHDEAIYGIALLYNTLHSRISSYLAEYNLSVGKFNILLAIQTHGGEQGISQVEISKRLIVTPANMTRLLDKLEKEELVLRSPLDGDRRVNCVRITKQGSSILDRLWPGYKKLLDELAEPLSEKKYEVLSQSLQTWLQGLSG